MRDGDDGFCLFREASRSSLDQEISRARRAVRTTQHTSTPRSDPRATPWEHIHTRESLFITFSHVPIVSSSAFDHLDNSMQLTKNTRLCTSDRPVSSTPFQGQILALASAQEGVQVQSRVLMVSLNSHHRRTLELILQ